MDMETRNGIKDYAGTARKIGQEKIIRTLTWVYRWGWSSREIIARVAGDELRYAARLVKKGLLRKVNHPTSRMLPSAYVLTDAGLMVAIDNMAGLLESHNLQIDYPWVANRSRLAWTYFEHGLAVQKAMISLGCHSDTAGHWWAPEREMRGANHRGALPDGMVMTARADDNQITWIEIERSFKNEEQRALQLWDRLQALKAGRFHKIRWVCATNGLALALERALGKPFIPKTWRDELSRIWREPSLGKALEPLRRASSISLLGEME